MKVTAGRYKQRDFCAAQVVAERLRALGCRVWTRGWPDLLVLHGTALFGAEVKFGYDKPSNAQTEMQEVLWRAGIPVFEVRDTLMGEALHRAFAQTVQQGHTQIVDADALYRAVAARGERSIAGTLFSTQDVVLVGRCDQCRECVVYREDGRDVLAVAQAGGDDDGSRA